MHTNREPIKAVIYHNQELMHDFNELQIRVKMHLFDIEDQMSREDHKKPSIEEFDAMFFKIMSALKENNSPIKKRREEPKCIKCQKKFSDCRCTM